MYNRGTVLVSLSVDMWEAKRLKDHRRQVSEVSKPELLIYGSFVQ